MGSALHVTSINQRPQVRFWRVGAWYLESNGIDYISKWNLWLLCQDYWQCPHPTQDAADGRNAGWSTETNVVMCTIQYRLPSGLKAILLS